MTPESYIAAIRNKVKKEYARELLRYYRGQRETAPETTLGTMGRQAVRLNLQDLTGRGLTIGDEP